MTFLGFTTLEAKDLIGSDDPDAGDPGYFIVLQEPIGELRFGLNETQRDAPEGNWRDLSWPDVAVANRHIDLTGAAPAAPADTHGAAFGANSDAAQIAYRRVVGGVARRARMRGRGRGGMSRILRRRVSWRPSDGCTFGVLFERWNSMHR